MNKDALGGGECHNSKSNDAPKTAVKVGGGEGDPIFWYETVMICVPLLAKPFIRVRGKHYPASSSISSVFHLNFIKLPIFFTSSDSQ